jgi:hypothetical protein
VLVLLVSFGFHAVQINHVHYGSVHTHVHSDTSATHHENTAPIGSIVSLGEHMHMADKKVWLIVLFVTFLSIAVRRSLFGNWETLMRGAQAYVQVVQRFREPVHRQFSYIHDSLAQGVLHPKLY